jgi:hypothetical protein
LGKIESGNRKDIALTPSSGMRIIRDASLGIFVCQTVWGLPLSGICKLVLILALVALAPLPRLLGQSAPAANGPAEPVTTVTRATQTEAQGSALDASCEEGAAPSSKCDCGFTALLNRLRTASQPVPWANWSEHPLSVGCFAGVLNGGQLIDDWVGDTTGFIGGWRLGCDVDPYFGGEMRMAFGSPKLYDSYRADQALTEIDNANGLAPNDPARARYDHRTASLFQWDVDILYYPWGETRLRPYFMTGMGLTNVAFTDRLANNYQNTCLSMPVGMGLKYLCSERLAVRVDFLDDIAFATDHLMTQQNLSLTAGVELRFGGSRKVYWPWDPGRSFW